MLFVVLGKEGITQYQKMKIKEKSDIEDVIFQLDIIETSKDTKKISHMTSTASTLQEIESVGQGEEKQIRFLVWLARRYW